MRTSVDVHNYLLERDAPHEVFRTRGRLRSPEWIAAVLDLPPEQVGKVVIFQGQGGPVAVVVPSGREPDPARVRRAARQRSVERVTDGLAAELTGYLPEAIPPAGLPAGFTVLVDRSFDRGAVLYFPGGESRAVLKIRGDTLIEATGAKVASLVSAASDPSVPPP